MPIGMLALMRAKKDSGVTVEKEGPAEPDDSESEDDYEASAKEIIDAIHNNDSASLAEALKSFVSAC